MSDTFRKNYRQLTGTEKEKLAALKDKAQELHDLYENTGDSRAMSIAKTKLEESIFWATKHITE